MRSYDRSIDHAVMISSFSLSSTAGYNQEWSLLGFSVCRMGRSEIEDCAPLVPQEKGAQQHEKTVELTCVV